MKRVLVPLLLIVSIVVVGVVVWKFMPTKPSQISFVVIPFDDLSQPKDQGYLCRGLAESIFDSLNNVQGLKGCGIDSAFFLKEQGEENIEIGKKLGAEVWERALRGRKWVVDNLELIISHCRQLRIDRSLPVGVILVAGGSIEGLRQSGSQINEFPCVVLQLHLLQNEGGSWLLVV
ncbi:hypothetical protein ACFL02_01940 [Planctomycetota bacterium]